MRHIHVYRLLAVVLITPMLIATLPSCNVDVKSDTNSAIDSTAANIKMYSALWDDIINDARLDKFNDSNFTADITLHMKPNEVVSIDSVKAYYTNFTTGFSERSFTIKNIFGSGDQLVKHWNFKGKHTGSFFGIPATNKIVDLDGATIVKMRGGKVAEETDFFDNLEFMQQLELIPR